MELEMAIKHLSDNYMDYENHYESCMICDEINELFDKYEFELPKKTWDYED